MKKKILIILGILTVISFSISFYYYQKNNTLIENETSENNEINDDFIKELYQKVNPSEDAAILKENYENNTFTNTYILAAGAMNYIRKNYKVENENNLSDSTNIIIDANELNKEIKEIFGEISYQNEDFYVMNYEYSICGFIYQKDENKYISLSGCGGSMNESFVRKVVATKVENNTITITEKSIYIYNDWNDYTNKRYIYNDCQKTNLLDTIETDSHTTVDINIENYLENAATYEYIFTKENNNYIFKQFKKV
mgnify:CR=1 FL=1